MKIKWRENMAVKALAFLAAVAAFTAAAIMAWYQIANFDALWAASYSDSYSYTMRYLVHQDYDSVRYLAQCYVRRDAGEELNRSEKRSMELYEASYDPAVTNLRWQLLDQDGKFLYGNTQENNVSVRMTYWEDFTWKGGEESDTSVSADWEYLDNTSWQDAVNYGEYDGVCCNDAWRAELPKLAGLARDSEAESVDFGFPREDGSIVPLSVNTALADENSYTCTLRVGTSESAYIYVPTIGACLEANRFGYIFDPDGLEWNLDPNFAPAGGDAGTTKTFNLILWVDDTLQVNDQYRRAALTLEEWQYSRGGYLALTVACGVLGILLMVYLCCGAGHKRGVEGVCLNRFHRLPGDVLLCAMALGGISAVYAGIEYVMYAYQRIPMYMLLLCVGLAVSAAAALAMGALITVCARCKARTLLRDTLTWKLCAGLWHLFLWGWYKLGELFGTLGRVIQAVPLIWKAVMGCMAYAMFTFWMITSWRYYSSGTLFPWLIVTFLAACYLCTWAYQWKRIRHGTQEIIGGNPNYHIDTWRMLPDLRGHADELNNLGQAISTAVDQRVKSEHFRAELITNVSHDLKTPLTSIINYVDLLKKEDIGNPKAREYIEVLDRKSQRLKKLTEDLVEASKASTGSLSVSWERLDWAQLTDQALAECGERLEGQKLAVVRSLPEHPVWVEADGRHLWRVLDNLLTNCAKYALPGTRVYVDLRQAGDRAVLSVKNISRDPLDIPAERLMERFVRGDESRNTSGSGLGLSIAQSLTELQHGAFEISIDGDLFKAIVTLPLAGDSPGDPISLIL